MAVPSKKAKTSDGEMSDELTSALETIDGCQNEIDLLNEKASEEILKVEQKYNQKRRPLFVKRTQMIKKIPEFWLTAFLNHPTVSSIVDEDEEDCFEYLDILDVEETEDIKTGYKVHFHFRENPYFTNKCLTKEFNLGTGSNLPTSTSTPINWHEGKDLAEQLQNKAQTTGRRKRHCEYKMFFQWFCDNSDPVNDDIAEIIKDDLWPNPLQYFLVPDIEVEPEGDDLPEEEEHLADDDDEEEDDDEGEEQDGAAEDDDD